MVNANDKYKNTNTNTNTNSNSNKNTGFVAGALFALLAAALTIPLEQKRLAEVKKDFPDETLNGVKCS